MAGKLAADPGLSGRQHRHKTLSAYYANTYTLIDYLLSAPGSSRQGVLLEHDPEDYRRLVTEAISAVNSQDQAAAAIAPSVVQGTQQELVDRIIGEVARGSLSKNVKDVLISGDKVSSMTKHYL